MISYDETFPSLTFVNFKKTYLKNTATSFNWPNFQHHEFFTKARGTPDFKWNFKPICTYLIPFLLMFPFIWNKLQLECEITHGE